MPQPLLTIGFGEIRERVKNASSLSLFLSFDGALTPIVEDPGKVKIAESTRNILDFLSKRDDVLPAVVSGRALSDLTARTGIDRIVYVGNHGLEINGRGLRFIEPFAAAKSELLARISESLAANLQGIPGARVEYKGLTTSVHYRQTPVTNFREVERIVQAVVAPAVSPFYIDVGKMVLDVIPRTDWHMGAAVCWINSRLAEKGAVSIYVGDDRTDETAFRRLTDEITICVGNPNWSTARYHVSSPAEVREFLVWMSKSRWGTSPN